MKIYLDADASPVLNIVEELAEKYQLELIIVKNYNHHILSDYGRLVTVDNFKEAADLYIANHIAPGDILVSQDYGLMAMVLGKKSHAINQYGRIIEASDIDLILEERHLKSQMRRKKKIYSKFKKRRPEDDIEFKKALEALILENKK